MTDDPGSDAPSGNFRLSGTVRPLRYDLRLEVDPDAGSFAGRVTIDLELDVATERFAVHSLDLEWATARIELDERAPITPELEVDREHEWVWVSTGTPLPPGPARLVVDYAGDYCENLVGLYVSEMDLDGERRRLAVTQCESTHARRILPCFDEPEFKATFDVVLVVPAEATAVANGAEIARSELPDGRSEVTFAPTMSMSSYLFALVVGPLEVTEGAPVQGRDGEIALRVVHPPGKGALCDFALDVATSALGFFEDYYDLAYPGDKVDLVAIPDFAFGAMENMGCITFREVLLLVDPESATPLELQRVADVINHELAHMWFGNLVTMRWWNGIWLNEAFATFMEVSASDAYRPDWDVWTTFGLARAAAFETDALWSTRPIEFEVRTASDSEAMFDILTYEKGCSVLRMLEQYLGPEGFRSGIRTYLRRHAFANTDTSDLWDALEGATGEPVRRIAEAWIFTGGHPLVEVAESGGTVELDQRRALYLTEPREDPGDGADSAGTRWPVPLTLHVGEDPATPDRRLLLEERTTLGGTTGTVRPNVAGSGFYRSLLPRSQREAILGAGVGALERFCVLDDTWFGVLAGHLGAQEALATVAAAISAGEAEPSVWRRIGSILTELFRLAPGDALDDLRSWLDGALAPAAGRFEPGGATGREAEVASTVLSLRGVLGHDRVAVSDARELFASAGAPTTSADPAVLAGALEVVAHRPSHEEHLEILRRWREADNPQDEQRHLGAIVATTVPTQFDEALGLCLDEVRTQDAPYVLRRALANTELGPTAWQFVTANHATITARFPTAALPRMLEGIRGFTDPALAERVEDFLRTNPLPTGSRQVAQHVERMWASVAAARRFADLHSVLGP